jgi:hypothetical protein
MTTIGGGFGLGGPTVGTASTLATLYGLGVRHFPRATAFGTYDVGRAVASPLTSGITAGATAQHTRPTEQELLRKQLEEELRKRSSR